MTFTTGELEFFRNTQAEVYNDTCIIQTHSVDSQNAYGEQVAAWTDGLPVDCGFQTLQGRGEFDPANSEAEALQIDAKIRLPYGTLISRLDRVKITHRLGEALTTPEVFEVVSPIVFGASGLYLGLRRVEI